MAASAIDVASQMTLPLPVASETPPAPDTSSAMDPRLAIAVRKAVAEAPPLTPEQRDRIVQLLQQSQTCLDNSTPGQLPHPA